MGKAKFYCDIAVDEVFEYDIDSTVKELERYCCEAEFVFNLAGINRPQNQEEFSTVLQGQQISGDTLKTGDRGYDPSGTV